MFPKSSGLNEGKMFYKEEEEESEVTISSPGI
jgi:hypothetical protein